MSGIRLRTRRGACRPESGFTLLEVIISVVLLTMIAGAISAAFVTSMNSSGATKARVQASDDAQNIAAFLIRDAQAAGGVDPTNPTISGDQSLGVTINTTAIAAGCGASSNSVVFHFAWRDWVSGSVSHVHIVNYFYVTGTNQLVRATCVDGGTPSTQTLARDIASPPASSCNPAANCPGIPDSVSLTVTETSSDTAAAVPAYTYTLNATVRPHGQTPPSGALLVGFPTLLALGGCTSSSGNTPGVNGSGGAVLTVNGPSIIDGTDGPGCNLVSTPGGAQFNTTPPYVELPNGLPDPYASLSTPNKLNGVQFNEQSDCPASGGTNPAPSGGHFIPGVYQLAVSITNTVTFNPGTYFFCKGISLSGHANVTANGVLFYFAENALSISGANTTLVMSGLTSGPDAGLVIWMPRSNSTTAATFNGNTTIGQTTGTIYVPNVDVTINGSALVKIGSIIARTITFNGGSHSCVGPATVGAPSPTTGPVGTSVSISGSCFGASLPLTITVGTTTATITAGTSSDVNGNVTATFMVPNLPNGTYPISVSDGTNTVTSATSFTVNPPPKLVFTSTAVTGLATASPTVGPIGVQYQTSGGTPITTGITVNLVSSSSGAKFSATSGGATTTSITIPAGSSTANFFYGDTVAGTPTITASATGVASGTQQETINAGGIAGIVLSNITVAPTPAPTANGSIGNLSYSSTGEANNSGNVLTAKISLADQFGNLVNAAGTQTIDFSLVGSGSTVNPNGAGALTIGGGTSTSTASFTLTRKTGKGNAVTLTATLHGTTQKLTVTMSS